MLMITMLFSTLIFFGHAPFSCADEHNKQDIQNLKDAAAALKATHPDLGDKLSKYADKEAGEKGEVEEKKEREDERSGVGLVNEAAAALETSNPELSGALKKYAGKEAEEDEEQEKN